MDSGQRQLVLDQQHLLECIKVDDIRSAFNPTAILLGEIVRKAAVALAKTQSIRSCPQPEWVRLWWPAIRFSQQFTMYQRRRRTYASGWRPVLIDSLLEILQKMEEANIDDMTPKWAVLSARSGHASLREWFKTNSNDMYLPSTQEMMLRTGTLGTLAGMTLYRSNRTAAGGNRSIPCCVAPTPHAQHAAQIDQHRINSHGKAVRHPWCADCWSHGALWFLTPNQLFRVETQSVTNQVRRLIVAHLCSPIPCRRSPCLS